MGKNTILSNSLTPYEMAIGREDILRPEPRVIWTPQPRQAKFLARPEYEALYGGAAGGGKSWALLMWILEPYQIKSYQGLILRKTIPELEELITVSHELYPRIVPGCRWNENKKVWIMPSGARIYFGSMHHAKDRVKYQGRSFSRIGFDEGTHFLFEDYMFLISRNRPKGAQIPSRIRIATNPGGVGHGWVMGRFIINRIPEQSYVSRIDVNGEVFHRHKVFIPATVYDNPALLANDPNYIANLGMLPEAMRNALLMGDWDTFSGQAFVEWRNSSAGYQTRRWTHVIEPFKIPSSWRMFRSFDFGYAKPFSCHWYAMDEDGRMYGVRELYGCTGTPNEGVKWHPRQIAQEIRRIEGEEFKDRKVMGVADPAIWDASRGESVAASMEREGVFWTPGDNARIPGKMQMHYRLSFDAEGLPMLYFFSTCKHMIRTLPALVYDQTNVEDIDSAGEDHAYDECRYLMMEHPIPARRHHTPPIQTFDPLNQFTQPVKARFFDL